MRRRFLGAGLVAYGLLGLILVVGGAVLAADQATRVERLAGSADGSLAAASRTLSAAADALGNVDEAMSRGRTSSESAARLARDAAATFRSLATAMNLTIFGVQPLLPLAEDFRRSGAQSAQLGTELDGIGQALDDSRTDLAVVAGEMRVLVAEIDRLRGGDADGPGTPPLRPLILLFAVWLAMLAIAALTTGLALLVAPLLARQSSTKNGSSP